MIDMNIETDLFLKFKEYMLKNSKYLPNIFPKAPQSLTNFPTIVMKEYSNVDNNEYKSTNRQEFVNSLSYRIEIYTKDQTINGKVVSSKVILNELKYLVMDFFNVYGFERTQCEYAEYLDVTVDRLIILERALINNWNKKIAY